MLSLVLLLARLYIIQKEKIPTELFVIALKDENEGHFEEALVRYESAMNEIKKVGFHSILKPKIIQKLRLLHTIIEYKKSFVFVRQ